jgi:hypothetical protein
MDIRKKLIIEINSFLTDAMQLHNTRKLINKNQYLDLESNICSLTETDFDTKIKYNYFLKFINQPELLTKRELFEKIFLNNPDEELYDDNNLLILQVDKYLRTLVDWLK